MYEHYVIDNTPKQPVTKDDDYDKEQTEAENEAKGVSDNTDYLPLPTEGTERFSDPDFDSAWDSDEDEDSDSDSVEENSSESDFETLGEQNDGDTNFPTENDSDDWEKV